MTEKKRTYELKERARRQAETRARIVEATVALHEEVGPARTTVAEIARRAGVQRLTVYTHFPDERDLFAACSRHFMAGHVPPDPAAWAAGGAPAGRRGGGPPRGPPGGGGGGGGFGGEAPAPRGRPG